MLVATRVRQRNGQAKGQTLFRYQFGVCYLLTSAQHAEKIVQDSAQTAPTFSIASSLLLAPLQVPSSATRDLLQDAVSEDVTIFLDGKTSRSVTIGGSGSRGGASAPTSHGGGGVVYLDCEGAIIEVNGGSSSAGGGAAVGNAKVGKLFIMPGQWGLTCGLGAEDL